MATPINCPACRKPAEQRNHCATRPTPCGWSRCTGCAAVWRTHDRHVMTPAASLPEH